MFYNARWYDSSLGRFTQADSIIPAGIHPHFMGAGGLDRYAIGALFSVYIPQLQQTEEGRRAQSRKGELSFSVLATWH